MSKKTTIFPILPRAWFHFSSSEPVFYIPLECKSRHRVTGNDDDRGKPCDLFIEGDQYCGHFRDDKWISHTLSLAGRRRKEHIEKYNKYRMELFHMAKQQGFQLPASGMALYYFFPMPTRWTRKQKEEMHGQLKISKPDLDNTNKAFFDALTGNDERVAGLSGNGKYYFNPDLVKPELRNGYIEIMVEQKIYSPFKVKLVNPYTSVEMEDIESRRAKYKKRKAEIKAEKLAAAPEKKSKPLKIVPDKKLFAKEDSLK